MQITCDLYRDEQGFVRAVSDTECGYAISGYYAKVIADSMSPAGARLTTFEIRFPRYILPEFNTHRVFSRNSASSRAIPVTKKIAEVESNPVVPVEFGVNRPGMQATEMLTGEEWYEANDAWLTASESAVAAAKALNTLNIHKQITNRILEPYAWHTVIVTSAEWDNFLVQRDSPLAQPEIELVAKLMKLAYLLVKPEPLAYGQWHLPYIQEDERDLPISYLIKISVARCARVSYLTHDGKRDIGKDMELWERLTTANPPHWSPLEHVATAFAGFVPGNFDWEWAQVRNFFEQASPRLVEKFERLNPSWLVVKRDLDNVEDPNIRLNSLVDHSWLH